VSIRCLALSGSLRARSSNTRLIEAAVELAPDGVSIERSTALAALPHFNPDDDWTRIPAVVDWVDCVRATDGLIVSTPEYARGIPGTLKNSLDWLVGTDAFVAKPFMLLNASPRALHAPAALTLVLQTMSGVLVGDACVTIDLLGRDMDRDALIAHREHADRIRTALAIFVAAIAGA
jgi:NAD(P)H-dependent FMN reductase